MPRLFLASNNRHKADELAQLIQGVKTVFSVHLARELNPHVDWDESGDTFLANARIKAQTVRALALEPGDCVLADDSGLVVDSLGGEPGVRSSRYAGEHASDQENNAKLLENMRQVPLEKRQAHFVCTLVFVDSNAEEHVFRGICPGRIALTPRGMHGFGYDPLFLVDGTGGKTMAELSASEKNALSHRRRAMEGLLAHLS